MLNFIEKALSVRINPCYNIKLTEIIQLREQIFRTNDISRGIIEAFIYGYYNGQRASECEQKSKNVP